MKKLDPVATLDPGRAPSKREDTQPKLKRLASTKVHERHLERLAIVYVRQSTPQQMVEHRESLARQYALSDYAVALGWCSPRVLTIDEDLGKSGRSAEGRSGFQRLLAEVSMDHVGIVMGLEMSRFARSCKDWHHLLEVCAVFGTLLADQDGVYDPNDPNDRLLLGLRGTISEVELHTMRNRLDRGKMHKAERGELFMCLPIGYAWSLSKEVILEPDEQARNVVQLIFDKFTEFGSTMAVFRYLLEHNIKIGVRPHDGPNPGVLTWRRPSRTTIFNILRHPMYSGTYVYGRCPIDHKRRVNRNNKQARKWVPRDEWKVMIHDRVPAYITWDQYEANLERMHQNASRWCSLGSPRQGAALLGGLAVCGHCGHRFSVLYSKKGKGRYDCFSHFQNGHEKKCQGITSNCIDQLVAQQVLRALEPASLELSVQACEDIRQERERLTTLRQQDLQRAAYEATRAERHYRSVDPENRLVASTLEKEWETSLNKQRQLQEDFERFQREIPQHLTESERAQIHSLATDLPGLWHGPETTSADRKEIVRSLIDKVLITTQGATEHIDVTIHWKGGFVSQHAVIRRVRLYDQLRDFDAILERVRAGHAAGLLSAQIAEQLQQAGFPTIDPALPWNKHMVLSLLRRSELLPGRTEKIELAPDEWLLADLARETGIGCSQIRRWMHRSHVHWRQSPLRGYYILWADAEEQERLRKLSVFTKAHSGMNHASFPKELITPKRRKPAEKAAGS